LKRRVDWFLLGMCVSVGLAFLVPEPGAQGGALHPELLNKLGVALIFFLHGLTLSVQALRRGTLLWRLHLVVQLATFLLFPLLGVCLLSVGGDLFSPPLAIGLFYLCALPSTVSSSVAMTAVARGNVPAAVFNATLSSLLGVFLTPLWLGLVLGAAGQPLPLGKVILDLCIWLLLPFAIGQLGRPVLGALAQRHKRYLARLDRLTILLLVYTSFCDSVQAGVWREQSLGSLLLVMACSMLLFAVVMACVTLLSRALGFEIEERIAAVFCGSKKTLASGVPMARLIFGAHPSLSLILLPIMIYHPLQLVICGWMAGRYAARTAPAGGVLPEPVRQ
jgi:sodium/bile acid cotransporter 7